VVRDISTLQIMHLYTCLDQVMHMEWSSDSLFILCAMYKRGLVQVCQVAIAFIDALFPLLFSLGMCSLYPEVL